MPTGNKVVKQNRSRRRAIMAQPIKEYARTQINERISRAVFQMRRTRHVGDEESVHDLRVSIRRLQQALRLFRKLVDAAAAQRLRRKLRPVLKQAGQVRNRDIALAVAREAGYGERSRLAKQLTSERLAEASKLRVLLADRSFRRLGLL